MFVSQTAQIIKDLRTAVLDALIDLSPCERAPRRKTLKASVLFAKGRKSLSYESSPLPNERVTSSEDTKGTEALGRCAQNRNKNL